MLIKKISYSANKLILYISLLGCILVAFSLNAQNNQLLQKAEELIYTNPDEAIKIGKHILSTSRDTRSETHLNLILGKSYLIKGDYDNAALSAFKETDENLTLDLSTQARVQLLKSELLRILYLDRESQKHLFEAKTLVSRLQKSTTQDSLQCLLMLEHINMKLDRRHDQEAIKTIDSVSQSFKFFFENHKVLKRELLLFKGIAFNRLMQSDSAFFYINKAKALYENNSQNNLFEKALLYSELGDLYLQNEDFEKSEEILFMALKYAEVIDNPALLMKIQRGIAISYLATNQKSKYRAYNDKFLVLNNRVELMDQKAINTVYNLISKEQEDKAEKVEKTYEKYQSFVVIGGLIAVLMGCFVVFKSWLKKKRLKEINKYLEISRAYFSQIKPTKKTSKSRTMIPEETERGILIKLKRFENSQRFLNKDMSLAVLAGQFETNTKYLSEIINKHYNDNFNTFINKLRINYIINKLKKDSNYINYKISFLAEESGYSSHSSFATVFKSIIGMSPATFINLIKEDRESSKDKTAL